jgi:RNA 2',3'-cyclic 3'-phosphodiesterase
VRAEGIHLTLAFLGEVEAARLPELRALPVEGARHTLPIDRASYRRRSEIVWVEPVELPGQLLDLASLLKELLRERRFELEARDFKAHVTLIRRANRPGSLPQLPPMRWPVEEATLVRSTPAAGGSDYEVLRRWALR